MTDRSTDLGSEVTSSKRARALVMIGIGVAAGLYALLVDPQSRPAWLIAGFALAAGLLQLVLAPLHGRAIDWAARKGQECRRRRDESAGRG